MMLQMIASEPYIRLILTVVVIIVIAYILFKFRASKHSTDSSLDIMKKRYEQGEISKEDYEEAKRKQGKH